MAHDPPPLADVFVVMGASPEAIERQAAKLLQRGYQIKILQQQGCLLAERPFPDSTAMPSMVLDSGLVFAEGSRAALGRQPTPERIELLLRYCEQPQRLAERLAGDFSFVHVDPVAGRLLAVRSCGGMAPLYIWQSGDSTLVSTSCTDLATVGGWNGHPEPLTTAIVVTGWYVFPERRTHLEGVSLLGIGEACVVSGGARPQWLQYWNPQPVDRLRLPNRRERLDRQAELRTLLLETLAAHLDPAGGNLISLSGGVDSATLTALITDVMQLPLETWSLVPPVSARFHARETDFLKRIRERYRIERYRESSWSLEQSLETYAETEASLALPPLLGMVAVAGFPETERPRAMVGGEGADEVVGSDAFTVWDWAASTPLWRCFMPGAAPTLQRGLRWWLKRRFAMARGDVALSLPRNLSRIFAPEIHAQFADYCESLRREGRQLPIENRQTWQLIKMLDFQPASWEAASALGIRRFFPFRTRGILELSLASHPTERLGSDTKLLLRGAVHNDVDPEFLYRRDKGNFGNQGSNRPSDISALIAQLRTFPAYNSLTSADLPTMQGASDRHTFLHLLQMAKRRMLVCGLEQ